MAYHVKSCHAGAGRQISLHPYDDYYYYYFYYHSVDSGTVRMTRCCGPSFVICFLSSVSLDDLTLLLCYSCTLPTVSASISYLLSQVLYLPDLGENGVELIPDTGASYRPDIRSVILLRSVYGLSTVPDQRVYQESIRVGRAVNTDQASEHIPDQ